MHVFIPSGQKATGKTHDFDDLRKKVTRKRVRLVSRVGGCAVKTHRKKRADRGSTQKDMQFVEKGYSGPEK
jgi:hypothetical protein